jgi:E3 ubiquitin-protein ligase HERC1
MLIVFIVILLLFRKTEDSYEKLESSPVTDAPAISPLQLPDALAACVLSTRLASSHRQWASQQLV